MSTTWVNVVLALVLAVALAVPHFSIAQSDTFQNVKKRVQQTKRQYCGRNLSSALSVVCGSMGVPLPMLGGQGMGNGDNAVEYDDSYPFKSRASANALMGRFGGDRSRRQRRSIHDECCVKECSITDLASYCPTPP